ncbi:MAG: T9SS type A sorting domain-containing protein [Prolixibacteraceae bacterium]|nr:T9SS type A sorting domain-containing protein [Prolixibacteraceae bacterium]
MTSATTVSLNSYINTDIGSVGIDQNEVITDDFEWTLPSGWSTTTGQTGTFVSTSSISVIPPSSATATSISVRAKANTQYSSSKTLQITRNLPSFNVSGQTPVLYNTTYRYEVPSYPGCTYSWQLPNGWSGSSTTNYIDVTVGCSTGVNITATITGCNQTISKSLTITNNYINPSSQILGPEVVCYAGNTFQVSPAPPTGTTISWDSSFNLTKTAQSGNTATFNANNDGNGWVEATISMPGCTSITLPRKTTWMSNYYFHVTRPDGIPVTTDQYGTYSLCPYTDYLIELRPKDYVACYATDQNWTIPSTWTTNYISGNTISINPNGDQNNVVAVDAKSCCYEDIYYSYLFEYSSSCSQYLMSISPNPSSSEATLTISTKSGTMVKDNIEWDLEVYDSMQALKAKTQRIKGSKQTINTSSWKDGVYMVRAKVGRELVSVKMVVKH